MRILSRPVGDRTSGRLTLEPPQTQSAVRRRWKRYDSYGPGGSPRERKLLGEV